MIPQGLAMVKQSFPPGDLQKAFIPFGPIMGLAAVLGPILAGFLHRRRPVRHRLADDLPDQHPGRPGRRRTSPWRYLPQVPRDRAAGSTRAASLLLAGASALLIYPLVQGREHGWPAWTFAMMAASAVLFACFVGNERRSAAPGHRARRCSATAASWPGRSFLASFFVAMTGVMLVLNLFIQLGLGFTPMHTGLAMTPLALGHGCRRRRCRGPRSARSSGRHVLHGGLAVTGLGTGRLWWPIGHSGLSARPAGTSPPHCSSPASAPALIFAPLFDIILADLGDSEVGTGSGLLNAAAAVRRRARRRGDRHGVLPAGCRSDGWADATKDVVWVSVACYAVSFLVAFLLPKQAREDAELPG